MTIFYDLIFLIFALVTLPVYLFKGKFHRGFLARLGFMPQKSVPDRPIWIHAVSVGEAMSMRGLIEGLRSIYPLILRRVIKKINPCFFIIAETEIWPNLIAALYKQNVPIAILNARISDRSFRGYSAIKYLLKPILNKVNIFCAQSEKDSLKLNALGVNSENIKVTGNMKFDQIPQRAFSTATLKERIGLGKEERLFLAGSTHPGEEEILLSAYRGLLGKIPGLRLLLAPRHPERADELESLVKNLGFKPQRISSLNSEAPLRQAVFILDTVGELVSFYALADIVFVGGSLVRKGGHNILEPSSVGKPVIFGPYMFNFRDIAQEFLDNHAALQVNNQEDLSEGISDLLNNGLKAGQLVKNAGEVIRNNQGATKRNISLIAKFIT
jgi:3-deoxy-D-manno-octulosonic-acid transferase